MSTKDVNGFSIGRLWLVVSSAMLRVHGRQGTCQVPRSYAHRCWPKEAGKHAARANVFNACICTTKIATRWLSVKRQGVGRVHRPDPVPQHAYIHSRSQQRVCPAAAGVCQGNFHTLHQKNTSSMPRCLSMRMMCWSLKIIIWVCVSLWYAFVHQVGPWNMEVLFDL